MTKIIDGKQIAKTIENEVAGRFLDIYAKYGITPTLAVIKVGINPPSEIYLRNIGKKVAQFNGELRMENIPATATQKELQQVIEELNRDSSVHSIMLQQPLPDSFDAVAALELIAPEKDVDGAHPNNLGKIAYGRPVLPACTAQGVIEILKHEGIEICGKNAVIIGRSTVVGKPLALMLLNENATITLCHSKTVELEKLTSQADILISAVGSPEFITRDKIKKGAVVIDVGINRGADGKITGDLRFEDALDWASHVTPVPGGTGPVTVAVLFKNLLKSVELAIEQNIGCSRHAV